MINVEYRFGRAWSVIALLTCYLSLTGCGSFFRNNDIPLLSTTGIAPAAATEQPALAVAGASTATRNVTEFDLVKAIVAGELRFQSGDSIKVAVWGYPELDHTATVQPNGKITVPLAGEIEAAGATVADLRQRVTERLQAFAEGTNRDLRPGDTLTMEVWQQPELRYTATIEPDGMATFPLAGRIPAVGQTVDALRKQVETRLLRHMREVRVSILPTFASRRMLRDHHVSVLAARLEPRRVALIGEVNNQGMSEIKGSLRIVEALALAQLRQTTAALNSVVVIRNPDTGSPQYRMIRLGDYFDGRAPDQNIYLQHNDIVIVPRTTIAKVGDFVEQFFTRTAPIFNWWAAAWQSTVAPQSAETTRLINEALRRSLVSPTVTTP